MNVPISIWHMMCIKKGITRVTAEMPNKPTYWMFSSIPNAQPATKAMTMTASGSHT